MRAAADVALVGAESEENLALRYLASSLIGSGRRVRLVPLRGPSDAEAAAKTVLDIRAGLVGLSMTFQAGLPGFLDLVNCLGREGYPGHLCAGGQFATVSTRRLLELSPRLDSVARGEGERTIVELARAVRTGTSLGSIAGLTWRDRRTGSLHENPARPAEVDLDMLPRPIRTPPFTRQAGLPIASMLGSRGCVQGCTYCSIQTFGRQRPGPRQRFRSVPDVVDEMAALYWGQGVRIFIFHDDNFLCADIPGSLDRAEALRREISRRGLDHASLVIKIRPDIVTRELVGLLRSAGLVRAYVGIESGNPRGLKILGRGHTVETNHRALRAFEECRVFACYNLLTFHPETTLEDIQADVAFARHHPRSTFNVGRVEVYAGTPLERWLRRKHRLYGPEFSPRYRITDPRAELASRILAVTFERRAFHLEGLLNAAASFAYEACARRRVSPSPDADALQAEVEIITEAVNRDTCDRLMEMVAMADTDVDQERFRERVSDLAWTVSQTDGELEARIRGVRARMQADALPAGASP